MLESELVAGYGCMPWQHHYEQQLAWELFISAGIVSIGLSIWRQCMNTTCGIMGVFVAYHSGQMIYETAALISSSELVRTL